MKRIISALGALFGMFALYWKARSDGKEALRLEQEAESHRRMQNAVEADVRARERIARGELLTNDGHRRD